MTLATKTLKQLKIVIQKYTEKTNIYKNCNNQSINNNIKFTLA